MTSNNVDNLINSVYADGYIRQNKYSIDMSYTGDFVSNIPAYAIRIPGWDISTVSESNVAGGDFDRSGGSSVKHFPYRKNWRQELFVTFFMEKRLNTFDFVNKWANSVAAPAGPRPFYEEQVKPNYLRIKVGEYADNSNPTDTDESPDMTYVFEEAFPRVVYPIELKPIEDVSPFIFSVQFNYRYFNILDNRGVEIG